MRITERVRFNFMRTDYVSVSRMVWGAAIGLGLWSGEKVWSADAPPVVFDTKPAFMQVLTNLTRVTNAVVVTNYVVVTNVAYVTNLYNAAGQLLQPVESAKPPIPGLVPIPQALTLASAPAPAPAPAAPAAKPSAPPPDPAVVKAGQVALVKELLTQSLVAASNVVAVAESFGPGRAHGILMPEGITSFDRKKGQTLVTAMNTTAEKAAPAAVGKVQQAIAKLDLADPAALLKGGKDAGTTALLAAEGVNLSAQVYALVQQAGTDAGLGEAYRAVMLKGGGLLGAVLGTSSAVDIDAHITKGLMDAIFADLATKEGAIRTDPAARKTKMLQEGLK